MSFHLPLFTVEASPKLPSLQSIFLQYFWKALDFSLLHLVGTVNAFILRFIFRFVGCNSAQWTRSIKKTNKKTQTHESPTVTFLYSYIFFIMQYAVFWTVLQDVVQYIQYILMAKSLTGNLTQVIFMHSFSVLMLSFP